MQTYRLPRQAASGGDAGGSEDGSGGKSRSRGRGGNSGSQFARSLAIVAVAVALRSPLAVSRESPAEQQARGNVNTHRTHTLCTPHTHIA